MFFSSMCCVYITGRSMLYMALRLFDDYDLIRSFQLDVVEFLRFVGKFRCVLVRSAVAINLLCS